jgi:hypothetical protein
MFPHQPQNVSRIMKRVMAGALLALQLAAQTAPSDKIRQQVGKIGNLNNVTVSMRDGHQYYGLITQVGQEEFSVNEVDLKREMTRRYRDVKKVRQGYGTTRNIYGQRIHPRTKLIVTVAVIGGLLVLVFVAVATDKS